MTHYNEFKTECPLRHPYDEENTYVHRGKRSCRKCRVITAREKRSRGLAPGDPRHGTVNTYQNYNCRCDLCKSAYSEASGPRNAWAKYGLSNPEYEVLVARFSEFGCDLCSSKKEMQVDHCHESGRVRGALCARCNSGLGKFKDSPQKLRKAAEYLLDGKLEGEDFEGDIT